MRTKIIFISIILIAFFYASNDTHCQSLFVWGNVKWITGIPSVGFEVKLMRLNGEFVSTAYTNQSGSYAFFGITGQPSGHYIMIYYKKILISQTRIPEIPLGQQVPDIFLNKMLFINVVAVPQFISPGQSTAITVHVYDEIGQAVQDVTVTIAAGGGKFLEQGELYNQLVRLHGPYSVSGLMDIYGKYTTHWVCNPCAKAYILTIECIKKGYIPGVAELTINIDQ